MKVYISIMTIKLFNNKYFVVLLEKNANLNEMSSNLEKKHFLVFI